MKPGAALVASEIAGRLRDDILPAVEGFRANIAAMSAAMLDMVAEEWDRAAARLVEENRATAGLLRQGAALTGTGYDADAPEDDLRISALERVNERLRRALIELQTELEARDDAIARALDDAIWAELRRSVERRRIGSANF